MIPKKILFGPFVGELGWELLFWQGWVRKLCKEEFSGYQKIAVSRLGHHIFYDSCDEFIPIPDHLFPKDYSARGYISDGWQDGYPSNNGSYRWRLHDVFLQMKQRTRPHKTFFERPNLTSSNYTIFENYLNDLSLVVGKNAIMVVPWKMNYFSAIKVGFEMPSNPKFIARPENTFIPDFRYQDLGKIRGDYNISASYAKKMENLVAVLPRSRSYRREDKNWSEAKYLELIQGLVQRGKTVVLVGSPGGAYFSNYTPEGCINLINEPAPVRLSVQIRYLQECNFAIGAMSGAMLLALASGCPSIIFGEQSQMHRYYYENYLRTRLNYVADINPEAEQLLSIVDAF